MSDYVLYGYPGSGSAVVEAALVLGAIPHRLEDLDAEGGALEDTAFRSINPRGQVPALRHPDGSVITEIPAILSHLADAHPASALAPPAGSSARAQHDRWLAFLHANVYEGVLRYFYSERYTTDPDGAEGVRRAAHDYLMRHFALFGAAIGEGPFFFGARPSGVDLLVWAVASWLPAEEVAGASPPLARLTGAMQAWPALAAVVARHAG